MPKYNVEIEHKHIYIAHVETDTEEEAIDKAWVMFARDEIPLVWDDFWVTDVQEETE